MLLARCLDILLGEVYRTVWPWVPTHGVGASFTAAHLVAPED
jgi:hypothetical protein